MKVLCDTCSKEIKGRIKTCVNCGLPVCFSCRVRNTNNQRGVLCKECATIKGDRAVVDDYFKDKYEQKEGLRAAAQQVVFFVMVFAAMLLFATVTAATPISDSWSFANMTVNPEKATCHNGVCKQDMTICNNHIIPLYAFAVFNFSNNEVVSYSSYRQEEALFPVQTPIYGQVVREYTCEHEAVVDSKTDTYSCSYTNLSTSQEVTAFEMECDEVVGNTCTYTALGVVDTYTSLVLKDSWTPTPFKKEDLLDNRDYYANQEGVLIDSGDCETWRLSYHPVHDSGKWDATLALSPVNDRDCVFDRSCLVMETIDPEWDGSTEVWNMTDAAGVVGQSIEDATNDGYRQVIAGNNITGDASYIRIAFGGGDDEGLNFVGMSICVRQAAFNCTPGTRTNFTWNGSVNGFIPSGNTYNMSDELEYNFNQSANYLINFNTGVDAGNNEFRRILDSTFVSSLCILTETSTYNTDAVNCPNIKSCTYGVLFINGTNESAVDTELHVGLYDEDYTDISNTTSSGQEFRVWANYSYLNNGSWVWPSAWCNLSADDIYSEEYNYTSGSNISVCGAGCTSSNYSVTFTGMHTEGFSNDTYRFRLCRNSTAVDRTFTVHTNNSILNTYQYSNIPYCGAGYVNFSFGDNASGGSPSVTVYIWSSAAGNSKSLVLVDRFVGIDRLHDAAENLTWNGTLHRFVSDEHEYYTTGSNTIYVDCWSNLSNVENQSQSMTVVVNNIPPVLFIDLIWESVSNYTSFTDGVAVKYPVLVPWLNITGGCQDNNLYNAGINLTFVNGTLIYEASWFASGNQVPAVVNLSQGNFSTSVIYLDELLSYTFCGFCNDTDGNLTSECRSFTAGNDVPVVTWSNSSPVLIGSVPFDLNWSCVDDEGEVTTSYLLINNSNWSVVNQSGGSGYNFSLAEGIYNLSVRCDDSFRNSSQADLTVSYQQACMVVVAGLVDGERYRNLTQSVGVSCSNGVNVTGCWFETNNYALEEGINCSGFTVLLERGWNDALLTVQGNGLNVTEELDVWAADPGSDVFDYVLLWVYIAALTGFFVFGAYTGLGVFYALGGVVGVLIGFELAAISWWAGMLIGSVLFIGCVLLLVLKKN